MTLSFLSFFPSITKKSFPFIILIITIITLSPSTILSTCPFPLNPKSPFPTFWNPKCDQSEYQFIPLDSDYISSPSSSLFSSQFIVPELFNYTYQILKLVHSPSNFPHPRTVFLDNDPKYNPPKNLPPSLYKIDTVNITQKKYMVTLGMKYNPKIIDNVNTPLKFNGVIPTIDFFNSNIDARTYTNNSELQKKAAKMNKFQKFFGFPFCWDIHNKAKLYYFFSLLKKKFPEDYNYMPFTYTSPFNQEVKDYFNSLEIDENNLWIMKSSSKSCGNGVRLFIPGETPLPETGIISKYVTKPLLINERKFDMRLYVFITGFSPLKVYLHKDILVRLSSEKYSLDLKRLNDSHIHLTNNAVNKDRPKKQVNDEEGIEWTFPFLNEKLKARGIDFEPIRTKIKDLVVKMAISYHFSQNKKMKEKGFKINGSNFYQLIGIDVLLDENLKPWLMEANIGIGGTGSKQDNASKRKFMTDLYNLLGIVPYNHEGNILESMDNYNTFRNEVDENVYEAICEFERPQGDMERVFPRGGNIEFYQKFFQEPTLEDIKLWEFMKKNRYE